jgi:hypothetical protein
MAQEDSRKQVLVGLKLQTDRQTKATGPATRYIIPAAAALLDAPRKFDEIKGENAQHILGVVPLAYNTKMAMAIFGYPDKSGLGELLAMAIAAGTSTRRTSMGAKYFIGSGDDDVTLGGTYSGTTDGKYEVEIDHEGTPDSIKWRKDGGAYTEDVAITKGVAQTLAEGVTVNFADDDNHTAGDKWYIPVFANSAYRHTFTPADLPPVATVWQKEVAGEISSGSVGCNKLTLDVPNNSEMKATGDLVGSTIGISSDMGTPIAADYPGPSDGSKIFRSGKLTLTFGEAAAAIRAAIKDVKAEIDRGIKIEEGQTQDADYPTTIAPTQNLLTLDLEFLQSTLAELQRSWEGVATQPTATSPGATIGHPAANVKYSGPIIYRTRDVARQTTGTGLDDVLASGAFIGDDTKDILVKITSITGTDKFKWSDDAGVSWSDEITATGSAQLLEEGVSVTMATTGHSLNDVWTIACTVFRYELEIDIPYSHIKYVPAEKGSRRSGKITLTPVAGAASVPYTVYLQNTTIAAYAAT